MPKLPIKQRKDDELIEDLCIQLRNVGVNDSRLPVDTNVIDYIEDVRNIYKELTYRNLDFSQ
jgi:hypothetical protein